MRHRRRTFLSFGEGFLYLAELALLQGANFGSELVERRCDQSQCRHVLGMTIALQRLRRNRRGARAQFTANEFFHEWIDVRVSTDCAGDFAELDIVCCPAETLQIPLHFLVPERHLQTEGRRFSMHAVRAAHHRGIFIGQGLILQNLDEIHDIPFQNFICLLQ
ncbi:hypothetical protein D3C81_1603130 [compost metagenome]